MLGWALYLMRFRVGNRQKLVVLVVLAVLALIVLQSVPLVRATQYVPGLKAGDTATWSLLHFNNASQVSMTVLSVNGSVVIASLTLTPDSGGEVVRAVAFDVLGRPLKSSTEDVTLRVSNGTSTSMVLSVAASGVLNSSATETLSKSDITNGLAFFQLQKNGYSLQTSVFMNSIGIGQAPVYMVSMTLYLSSCQQSSRSEQGSCTSSPVGSENAQFSGAVGSQVSLSIPALPNIGASTFGLSLPPLVIASVLSAGDQINPYTAVSLSASSGIILGASRQEVTASVDTGASTQETYAWDRLSGLLASYSESGSTRRQMQLVSTNVWSPTPDDVNVVMTNVLNFIGYVLFGSPAPFSWGGINLYLSSFVFFTIKDEWNVKPRNTNFVKLGAVVIFFITVFEALIVLFSTGVI